jgi:glycosyltransferase involved in cell wall biosynthesis
MKVFHVIDSGGLYGAENMLLSLVKEQQRMGIEPVIASIGDYTLEKKPLEIAAEKNSLPLEVFRMAPGPNLYGAAVLLRRAWQLGTKIIHSHGYKGNILLGLLPSYIRKLPIVSTLHGWTGSGGFNKMTAYEIIDRFALRFVNAIVCVNAGMLSKPALKKFSGKHLHVVDNGLPNDDAQIFTKQQALADIPDKDARLFQPRLTIGSIGRLSKEKGYNYLLEALNHVIKSGIDAQLFLIGEGPEYQNLCNIASHLKLESRVHIIGYREKASRYMKLMDIYAISSLTEGLPITLLEAMRAQIPVVATEVGGIPIALNHGVAGVITKAADARSLANGIISIARDRRLRNDIIKNAFRRFIRHYTSRRMSEEYLSIYMKLTEARTGKK